jgi:isopenicillin-N N-acyltransferase-like protein
MLGSAWKEALELDAAQAVSGPAWWKVRRNARLISRYAPHLPDLFRGMAAGAGVDENLVSSRAPPDQGGCTSFALAPSVTVDAAPLSGQNKDVPLARGLQLMVLRLSPSDAPASLTLTYAGWLFGHGFVRGGTAVFRNQLYIPPSQKGMPYAVWGLLALHCRTVDEVVELTREHGVRDAFHVTVADEHGGIIGIEHGAAGTVCIRPKRGVYTHANCVLASKRLMRGETPDPVFHRADSLHRTERMRQRLEADRGRLTVQSACAALCDHDGYPVSICRHESKTALSAASVVAEPTRGRLLATRGLPCQNWPQTFRL